MRGWLAPIASTLILLAIEPGAARGQVYNFVNLDYVNHRLDGHVDDYSHNHGEDRRLFSEVLGQSRDLYVYTPPGFDRRRQYPVILFLHMGYVDEHVFLGSTGLFELDRKIRRGEYPPVVVACPDGMYGGENRTDSAHSLFVNGRGGRFEDHLVLEVLPFLIDRYAVNPDRRAHGILGLSAGGFGGLSLAMRRPDLIGAVATLASPVNIRYSDVRPKGPRENFSPYTYRWKERYDPEEVYGVFYFGLRKSRAKKYIDPVFGSGPDVNDRLKALNPADLLFNGTLRPGDLAIYCHFAGRDNWNFDAHALSFAWLASSRGIAVELASIPLATHSIHYFRSAQGDALDFLSRHLLPPNGPWVLSPSG